MNMLSNAGKVTGPNTAPAMPGQPRARATMRAVKINCVASAPFMDSRASENSWKELKRYMNVNNGQKVID